MSQILLMNVKPPRHHEISDLRNELQRVKERQDGGQEEPIQVTCVNEGPAKHLETAKHDPSISENDGASSSSMNESENTKSSKSKVLLVSDSLLHKFDVKQFFC